MRCGILIPAFNEEASVAEVVKTALAARLGPVLVVDDGSADATSSVAKRAGAEVLTLSENLGKGGAVWVGAEHLKTDVIILLDADLTGLTPAHIRALAAPVLAGEADMTRGIFVGGRWATSTAQRLAPQLNGQRALLKAKLLEVPGLIYSRYGVEIAITESARHEGWRTLDVLLPGVSQVMKEEKRGFWRGFRVRLRMYGDILSTWLRNAASR